MQFFTCQEACCLVVQLGYKAVKFKMRIHAKIKHKNILGLYVPILVKGFQKEG